MKQAFLDRISIVISVYNCDDLVKRCIDSLITSLGGELPEFIIVDNAAAASTKSLIDQYASFNIKYHAMPKDGGFAGANNIGYGLTTKEFVVLVNSDTVFHENPFPTLIDFMDEHPRTMIAQGTVVLENGVPGEDGKLDTCGAGITTTGRITNPADKKDLDDEHFKFARKVFYAYGALFLFRREAPKLAGGFLFRDEFYAYYEETDFCHRMWLSGHEVWYVPTPIVGHAHTVTFKRQHGMSKLLIFTNSNRRCSLLSCLGIRGLFTVFPLCEMSTLLLALNHLFHGRPSHLRSYIAGLCRSFKILPKTFRRRKAIQKMRAVSDGKLFAEVFKRTTLHDFIQEIRGLA